MDSLLSKILVIALIFSGEAISIYAEMHGARTYAATNSFLQIFLKMFLVITIAGGFLIAGYTLGFNAFKNIWIVSVVSITSIIIVEPVMAITLFHQIPTKGAIIGFVLGVLGFLAAVFL